MQFDATRSTPAGYWRFAAEYFLAAEAVHKVSPRLMAPSLQLYGQSLELALKAFLLKRGVTLANVETLRHRLSEILELSRTRKLVTQVKLKPRDVALINLLGESYAAHRFRYIVTGSSRLPEVRYIAPICERVVAGLELYCTGYLWGIQRRGA
jgi:hypothetical protein